MLRLGIPLAFVLIWSTGFIVAKLVLPHADLPSLAAGVMALLGALQPLFIGFALALGGVLLTRSAPIREAGRPTQLG
jgi:hypothetical protein